MKDNLIQLLETLGYPVYLQGSMSENENYPTSFFTFWNFETPEASYYDNNAHSAIWGFWVYLYSNDPLIVENKLIEAKKILKENGWIVDGNGQDVASDEPTHVGRMITCRFIETY